jgi:hypothetical protein
MFEGKLHRKIKSIFHIRCTCSVSLTVFEMNKQKGMDSSAPLFVAPGAGSDPYTYGGLAEAVGQFWNRQAIFRSTDLATHTMAWRRVTRLLVSVQEFKASTLDLTNSMGHSPY